MRDRSLPGKHYRTVHGRHPALIYQELWDRVQRKLSRNANRPARNPQRVRPYPISGVGRCARCGSPLTGQFSNGRRIYYCSRRCEHGKDPAHGGCDLPGLYADQCEAEVAQLLEEIEIPPADKERILSEIDPRPCDTGPTLASLQAKLARYAEMYGEGEISREKYNQKRAEIKAQMAQIHPPSPTEITRAVDLLENVGQVWKSATSDRTQKELLNNVRGALLRLRLSEPYSNPENREAPTGVSAVLGPPEIGKTGSRGFEPPISALTGLHVRPLHHDPPRFSMIPQV